MAGLFQLTVSTDPGSPPASQIMPRPMNVLCGSLQIQTQHIIVHTTPSLSLSVTINHLGLSPVTSNPPLQVQKCQLFLLSWSVFMACEKRT